MSDFKILPARTCEVDQPGYLQVDQCHWEVLELNADIALDLWSGREPQWLRRAKLAVKPP